MTDTRDLADEARSLLTDDYDGLRPYHDLAEQLCGSVPFTQDDVVAALDGCDEPYLIPEHEFTDYARELAEDCGMIPDDTQWPLTCIDWTQAARELRYDYTAVTFDGASFLVRL